MSDNHYLLIVDDDATFTRILGRAMTRRGYQVLTAGTATEALDLCRQHNPRRAVVDLKLERDKGLENPHRIKTVLMDGSYGIDLAEFTQHNINMGEAAGFMADCSQDSAE